MIKVKRLIKQVRALFPSKLPVGMSQFESWADSFSDTYNLATQNQDAIRFVLATSMMHLSPTAAFKSKYYFYLLLETAASKQIASAAFTKIKEDDIARRLAEQAKQNEAQQQAV